MDTEHLLCAGPRGRGPGQTFRPPVTKGRPHVLAAPAVGLVPIRCCPHSESFNHRRGPLQVRASAAKDTSQLPWTGHFTCHSEE